LDSRQDKLVPSGKLHNIVYVLDYLLLLRLPGR
jgi:hypothetical protein